MRLGTGDDGRDRLRSRTELSSMQAFEQFRGFFSYAHHDVAVSSRLVKMLMELLPPVIEAHFTNVRFEIWQDTKLRTGDRWEQTIKDQLYKSDVLIVLLTPLDWFGILSKGISALRAGGSQLWWRPLRDPDPGSSAWRAGETPQP